MSDKTNALRSDAVDHFVVRAITLRPSLARLSADTQRRLDAFLLRHPNHHLNRRKST